MNYSGLVTKIIHVLLFSCIFIFLYCYYQGYDLSISWNVTASAESHDISAYSFNKGPFQFSLEGKTYSLAENFSAGPIDRNFGLDAAFLILILIGLAILLATLTYLPKYFFLGSMGLLIFWVINIHMEEVNLFGLSEQVTLLNSLLLVALILPAFLIHSFFTRIGLGIRVLIFLFILTLLPITAGVDPVALQEQFTTGSYFGVVIISVLFLIVIAEENIFGILYLITRTKGGTNNHIHFSVFSGVYLVILGLYYANKAGFIDFEIGFFDPFLLLAISIVVSIWSVKFKSALFENLVNVQHTRILIIAMGIIMLAFLALAMSRGNDAVYEGLNYFIIYTHLGFGVMFFFYSIINFVNPLAQGLQVHKIVYKEQNFPYVSARLAGLAAVAGFFFLANKEPLLLFRAGLFNYMGAQAEVMGNEQLGQEYYREGSIYGYNGHFSNYQLGYRALQKNDIREANFRFGRATLRYPSPQAFLNQSSTYAILGQTTPSLVSLETGLNSFPGNNQLLNNLGLTYLDLGNREKALNSFQRANPSSKWTDAVLVNKWKLSSPEHETALNDYQEANLAVKSNVLNHCILQNEKIDIEFDSAVLYPSWPLHRLTYLINASWYFQHTGVLKHLQDALATTTNESLYHNAQRTLALNYFLTGNINQALLELDNIQSQADSRLRAEIFNLAGIVALSQHALLPALNYFEQAVENGNIEARINKVACLLELGQKDVALEWISKLTENDSLYRPLLADIRSFDQEEMSLDQRLMHAYYFYEKYTPAELSALMASASKPYIRSLWAKIANEQLRSRNFTLLKTYRAVFNNLLEPQFFDEPDLLMALAQNQETESSHPLSSILSSGDTSLIKSKLISLAAQNSLNEPMILEISNQLLKIETSAAYDVLVTALNINRRSVALRKNYILTALELGLTGYAESALDELRSQLTQDEYRNFLTRYRTRKDQLESQDQW